MDDSNKHFRLSGKKDVIFRFAMDTLILVSPFGATLPCGCNLVLILYNFTLYKHIGINNYMYCTGVIET